MSIVLSPTRYEEATATAVPVASARLAAFESRVLGGDEQGPGKLWALSALVLALHAAVIYGVINRDTTPTVKPPQKHEIEIAFVKPEVEPPPPPPEPPKPPPPPPKVQRVAPPPPQPPVQQLRTAPATQDIAPNDLTVAENTEAPKSSGPVEAVAEPAPPAPPAPVVASPAPPAPPAPPPKEEPVTEAVGYAGYLNNPKPDYPGVAARNGWGGTVTLRVRVLASGKPEGVEVKKSSGRKVLDDAAIAAVKQWTFTPSKRGSTPIDGWATVPIVFNPEQ